MLSVRDAHGQSVTLPGLPRQVLDSATAVVWSFDGTSLYLAEPVGSGANVWSAPLQAEASLVERLDDFDGFVGATPEGILVFQRGVALVELTPSGSRTILPLASLDRPEVVSPDGRYVLMQDLTVSLATVQDGQMTTLEMPRGYQVCPTRGWPGPDSTEIVVYACGREDPTDTILIWYSRDGAVRYRSKVIEPPSDELCFDYSVDPVVVAPGVVSVIVTDRSGFSVGDAVGTGTWLIDLNGAGRR